MVELWPVITTAPIMASLTGLAERRVIKFDPDDKSTTRIRPDFGHDCKLWYKGAITDSSIIIYCPPRDSLLLLHPEDIYEY